MNVKYDYNLFYIYDTFQDVGVNRKRYNFSSWATSSSWLESGETKGEREYKTTELTSFWCTQYNATFKHQVGWVVDSPNS